MTNFDRTLARRLLECCRYANHAGLSGSINDANLRQELLKWISSPEHPLTGDPVVLRPNITSAACVFPYADHNVVAYMGTKNDFGGTDSKFASIADWLQNLEAIPIPFRLTSEQLGGSGGQSVNLGGKVHEGFLEELAAVQPMVIAALMEHGGQQRPLLVTGHSQGGAEAALATRAFEHGAFNVASTYTFAAPRPGDQDFVKAVSAAIPVHRLEFGDDIVPHVPPALLSNSASEIVGALHALPFLSKDARLFLQVIERVGNTEYDALGKLCYGSNKTKSLRTDLTAQQETALFLDRLWSLIRHPERWSDHHDLAGTKEEQSKGVKGNYTALVSDFTFVN